MGNSVSVSGDQLKNRQLNPEQLSAVFAQRCGKQFSGIELYSLKKLFHELSDKRDGTEFWSQDSLIKFLRIPDAIPEIGNLIFQSASFLAGYPFVTTLSPAPLTLENIVKIVAIYDQKYRKLMKPDFNHSKLIFLSFAAVENISEESDDRTNFTLDDLDKIDDLILLEAFDSMSSSGNSTGPFITGKNLQSIFTFLLIIQNFKPVNSLASYALFFNDETIKKTFRQAATAMLRTINFDVELDTKIYYKEFHAAVANHFPRIFNALGALFDQFLFENTNQESPVSVLNAYPNGKIVGPAIFSCLELFLPDRVGQFMKLYSGSENGFSLRSFQTKVFKWHSPTLLIVRGTRRTKSSKKHPLDEKIPLLKAAQRNGGPNKLVFGAYITSPWRVSSRESFASDESLLFQLSPSFEAYRPSSSHSDFAYFSVPGQKKGGALAGIGFGSAPPYNGDLSVGNVSLTLDEMLEYGVFRHAGVGGTFSPANYQIYEERFDIDELEVWGIGRQQDLEDQQKRLEWEEREAKARQRVNIKAASGGDFEEERALLEMAGLVGGSRSGGSM